MNNLLDLITEIEEDEKIFDMDKICTTFGYVPFFDYLKNYCKKFNKGFNAGITSFDWVTELTKEEVIELLKKEYKNFEVTE